MKREISPAIVVVVILVVLVAVVGFVWTRSSGGIAKQDQEKYGKAIVLPMSGGAAPTLPAPPPSPSGPSSGPPAGSVPIGPPPSAGGN